jgi:hypothetical protein
LLLHALRGQRNRRLGAVQASGARSGRIDAPSNGDDDIVLTAEIVTKKRKINGFAGRLELC